MKIAVIGANGFLGRLVAKHLKNKKYDVIEVRRNDLNIVDYADVRSWLKKQAPSVIINCAISGGKTKVNDIEYEDLKNNVSAFLNFYNNCDLFDRYINVGSGAEFDNTRSIISAREEQIFDVVPKSSYAYSKNIVSRLCATNDKFYTLRLFGCFDPSEDEFRFFKRMQLNKSITIEDKYFDMFSAVDFCSVVEYFLHERTCNYRDINCTYKKKYTLVALANMYREYHNLDIDIDIKTTFSNSYTGDYKRLYSTGVSLIGLEQSLKEYK